MEGMLGTNQGQLSSAKDVGLNANLRPNSINVIGEQPNLYPYDAFTFTDPNKTDRPKLGMKEGWDFDVSTIQLTSLDKDLQTAIEDASITAEENALKIKNTDGQVVIHGDSIDLIAEEVINIKAGNINITADKVSFTGTGKDLSDITGTSGTDVYIKGDLRIDSDDYSRKLSLGSQGLLVKDAANTIIHDLPTSSVLTDNFYCGHLIYANAGSTDTLIVDSRDPTQLTWHTAACKTFGQSNVKAGLFQVYAGLSVGAAGSYAQLSLRPYGISWNAGIGTPTASDYIITASGTAVGHLICPIQDGKIQWNPYFTSSTGTKTIRIYQIGIFV